MADPNPTPTDSASSSPSHVTDGAPAASRAGRIVWLLASAGFLGYLAFGSVEARIWNYGRLFFQDRKIVHVWAYFGDRLPDMPASPLIPVLFYLSLAVMIVATVVGLWYFLADGATDPSGSASSVHPDTSPQQTSKHG